MYGPGTLFVLAAAYGSLDEAVAGYGAAKASQATVKDIARLRRRGDRQGRRWRPNREEARAAGGGIERQPGPAGVG